MSSGKTINDIINDQGFMKVDPDGNINFSMHINDIVDANLITHFENGRTVDDQGLMILIGDPFTNKLKFIPIKNINSNNLTGDENICPSPYPGTMYNIFGRTLSHRNEANIPEAAIDNPPERPPTPVMDRVDVELPVDDDEDDNENDLE